MAEYGKRYRQGEGDSVGKYQKRRSVNNENPNDGELVFYRIICPNNVIGSVIGKGGNVINSIRQETNSKIKVVDPFPGSQKRVINIYCYVKNKEPVNAEDDIMEPLCAAQEGLLGIHAAIINALSNMDDDNARDEEVELLVPTSQASNIIGKSGSVIKKLRVKSKANIRLSPKDISNADHSCALSFDNILQITGDTSAVKKALLLVSAIMYKFPPKEDISLDTNVAEIPPSIIIPSDVPIYPSTNFYHGTDSVYPSANFYHGTDSVVAPRRSAPSGIGTAQHVSNLHGYADTANAWPLYPSSIPVHSGYNDSSRSEDLVVRILCPADKIGRVIGKGGGAIKSLRQTSGAHIEVDDSKKKIKDCIITISSTESTDDVKSAAIEAVLLIQEKIHDEDEAIANFCFLAPTKILGYLIGKGGSIINEMRKKTRADIRISKSEKPNPAYPNDEEVEVSGEVSRVRDALIQIVLKLREDALKDTEGSNAAPPNESLYTSSFSVPPLLSSAQAVSNIGYDRLHEPGSGLGLLSSSSLYGHNSIQPGESAYGSLYSSKSYGSLPSYAEMSIPSHAISKVLGKGGSNLANIRKISGADIEIVDSKTSRYERIAQISGTSEQKRDAENLIQAFIMAT